MFIIIFIILLFIVLIARYKNTKKVNIIARNILSHMMALLLWVFFLPFTEILFSVINCNDETKYFSYSTF